MFIWNNIFFSLGFDVRDHYKDFGGDAAAYTAPVGIQNIILKKLWMKQYDFNEKQRTNNPHLVQFSLLNFFKLDFSAVFGKIHGF